jgi:hypothetical protein
VCMSVLVRLLLRLTGVWVALVIAGRQAGDGTRRWRLKTRRYTVSMASTRSFRKYLLLPWRSQG